MYKFLLLFSVGCSIAAIAQTPGKTQASTPPAATSSTSASQAPALGFITIYTQPGMWRGAKKAFLTAGLGKHEEPATGPIYLDDQKELFFRTGRFITFRVNPGPHDLATIEKKRNPQSPQLLTIAVEPGHHYFFRMTVSAREFVLDFKNPRLEQVTCEVAQTEAGKTTPQEHFVEKSAKAIRVETPQFPTCQ